MADRRDKTDRRSPKERRRRSRRRQNDQRVFVVELTSNDLRVIQLERVGADAPDKVSASVTTWRKQSSGLHTPEGLTELSTAFREVAQQHSMAGSEIRLVLSGEYCILRVVRGAVEEVRAEIGRLEQRSRLYLSLGPGEKVLVSNSRALDARHVHAVAAACNRGTLETVQAAAEAAGIELAAIEPALSALCRAVGRLPGVPETPYLLVNLARSTTEIGICHEGRLLLDYRPGGLTRVADLGSLLESHLNRLNRHVARYLRISTSLKHIFICGEDDEVAAALKQFSSNSTLEVRRVRPSDVQATWQLIGDSVQNTTATALGGLLATYLPPDELDAPNLMQHILESQLEPLRPRLIAAALPFAATMLVAIVLGLMNAREQGNLNAMQAELDTLAIVEGRATELRLKLTASQDKLAQLEKLTKQLSDPLGRDTIARLGHCMPADVWLSRIEITDRKRAFITGASYLEAGVYDFVSWLRQAPGFAEAAIKRTQPSSSSAGPTTSFEVEVTLGNSNEQPTHVASHE